MVARQTILTTRAAQGYLSAEVAAVIRPDDLAAGVKAARLSQRVRHRNRIKTTFCPICGGNKSKESSRCASCRDGAMRRHEDISRDAVGVAIGRAHPERREPVGTEPGFGSRHSGRVRGGGETRIQLPPSRATLVDGKWVKETW